MKFDNGFYLIQKYQSCLIPGKSLHYWKINPPIHLFSLKKYEDTMCVPCYHTQECGVTFFYQVLKMEEF